MPVFLLDSKGRLIRNGRFPDPQKADGNGLLAIGGDLEPESLLAAYRQGIFPWSVDPISWWSPDPRAIIEFDEFKISSRRARYFRSSGFNFTFDRAFRDVVTGCAQPATGRDSTWISPQFVEAYTRLHLLGHAHSVECWNADILVGGVYGVSIGGFFAGESMFHIEANASTLALALLLERLKKSGFVLFDTQMVTSHTESLGAREIPRLAYLKRLGEAVAKECSF